MLRLWYEVKEGVRVVVVVPGGGGGRAVNV